MPRVIKSSEPSGPEWNIRITRGSTIGPYEISIVDLSTGEPIDLSGYEIASQIRATYAGDVVASLSFDLTDVSTGKIVASLSYDDCLLLTAASYVWDCTATHAGVRWVLWRGKLEVLPGVTRD